VSDAELVARVREGDAAAFGMLVERHQAAVYRAALAALGSPTEAEDCAQDAFVVAYRRLGTYRGQASFKTWLLTIVWRRALNRRRGVVRWLRRTIAPSDRGANHGSLLDIVSGEPSPEQLVAARRLREDLVREIRSLPVKLRDALLLAQSGEHSYDEIAAMLGIAVGTVKWRVAEARRVIKSRLEKLGYVDVGSR
jgi:RNA polymerase sigma-70 factor (ECF subfamily)